MNECEMQIQLRQPPPPIPSSLPTSSASQQAVHHRSRLETELNLQKQRRADKQKLHHSQDTHALLTPPSASAGARPPVTAAAVQHLLDSFDHRIRQRTTAATTKCVNMSSEQARIAGIPGAPPPPLTQHQQPSNASASRHIASPPNPAAAAAFMLLKNRIIPSAQQNHHNGVDLSASSQKVAAAAELGGPRRILSEQTSNRLRTSHSSNTNSNGGSSSSSNNHIPLTTSPGNAANNNSHSSPSSASSGSSDCNSPPSSNGAGGGGGSGGNGPGLNGTAKIAGNGGRLQFFKDGKFILELASSREHDNGRPGWVAVPRKIYWPPTAQGFTTYSSPSASTTPSTMSSGPTSGTLPSTLGTNTNSNHSFQKNESSASLSFSDDNSSIQSSPWHREHCWKQLTPRRSISRGMCFVYVRPRKWIELSDRAHVVSLRKRRRPFDSAARMLTSNEAFQRREVVLKHEGERVVKMETEEEESKCETVQEKTDLGTEKVNGDSVNEKPAASVEGEETGAVHVKVEDGEDTYGKKSAEGSRGVSKESEESGRDDGVAETMDEDAVDGMAMKVDGDDKERKGGHKDNSNSDETDSNKTVTEEDQVEKMDVKEEVKEPDDPDIKQQVVVKDTPEEREEVEKENIEKEQKEVKNKEMARGTIATKTTITTGRRIRRKRQDLERIVSTLLTSRKALLAKLKMSSPKLDALMHSHMHQHVSPRKRILREFERVTLDEANGGGSSASSAAPNSSAGKRHRARVHQNGNGGGIGKSGTSSSTFFVPSTGMLMGAPQSNGNGHSQHSGSGSGSSKLVNNGGGGSKESSRSQTLLPPSPASAAQQSTAASKPISSYSIISLLGHNSSGGGGGNNNNSHTHHSGSPRPEALPENLHSAHQQKNFASSQHQLHMESVAAAKGMDLLQYNKSLPPKKKLSPPPTSCPPASSSSSATALTSNWSSPKATEPHHHRMMRSPEMSPSPEHGGRSAGGGGAYKSATSSFHPYLNVSNRASPSDDVVSLNGGSRYAHHHRSSPQQQFVRDRHLSGSSPNSRYSPVHSSGNTNGKNPPAAHGAASPYSTSSRPSPMSATSPLSSHYFPALNAVGTGAAATGHSKANHHRSPSPAAGVSDRSGDRFLPQRRLIEEDRDRIGESELTALAIQQQQMEFERYAKFYGSAPHSMLGPGPPPPHLMMPGFEHMSEAAAAQLIRPAGNSSAALMNSLHQAAYLMYPPTGSTSSGSAGAPGAPYLPPSTMPYYQQYMAAAAAAAMYGRGNPLWPYMAGGGIPGPPGSPMRMPPGLHHSPQMMQQSPILGMGRDEGRGGFLERGGRMSPSSPLALRMGGERREAAVRESAMAMEQCRDDPDVPLNLSKH